MGVDVFLKWDGCHDNDPDYDYDWEHIFKLSCYPHELSDYGDFDASCPENLEYKYLKDYEKWLEKLLFFCKHAPEKYLEYSNGAISRDINIVIKCIEEDLKAVRRAYCKAKMLEIEGKNPRISVG